MSWRIKNETAKRLKHSRTGRPSNRECANCIPPCQGGEVLHRRGHCCHSYCPCEGFEAKTHIFAGRRPFVHILDEKVVEARKRSRR